LEWFWGLDDETGAGVHEKERTNLAAKATEKGGVGTSQIREKKKTDK